MAQMDNYKRRAAKLCEALARDLDTIGLASKVELRMTSDPLADLEAIHHSLVGVLAEQGSTVPESVQSNEITMLDSLRLLTSVNEELCKFSNILYQQEYSLEVYKVFRGLYEAISNLSNSLYAFESEDPAFLSEKDELISQSLQLGQEISKAAQPPQRKPPTSEMETQLRQEIAELHRLIEQNDEEYSIEIQKYNNTLFDLQETVREYEMRLDKVRGYETTIEDLEHRLIRLKEEKFRDDILIENMSKKIRAFEKQRGGNDIFLSPRHSYGLGRPASRQTVQSPHRQVNQSAMSQLMSQARSFVH